MQKYSTGSGSSYDLAELILEQDELEHRTDAEYGAAQLRKLIEEAQKGSIDHPRASRIIRGCFDEVCEHIDDHKTTTTRGIGAKFKRWLRSVETETIALISIREVIKSCLVVNRTGGVDSTRQNMAERIGRQLETEVKIKEARKVSALYMAKVERNFKDSNVTSVAHLRAVYTKAYKTVMQGHFDSKLTKTELIHR